MGAMPAWASGQETVNLWTFANEHGERWVARTVGDHLLILGMDSQRP